MAETDNDPHARAPQPQAGWADRLREFFTPFRDAWTVVKLCRFSVISVLTGIAFMMIVPQGVDVLVMLSEASPGTKAGFMVAVSLWTLSIWYFCRVIVSVRYPDWPPHTEDPRRDRVINFMQKHFPRALGLVAILSVALALALGDRHLGEGSRGDLTTLALVSVALAVVFYAFVVLRRRVFGLPANDRPFEQPGMPAPTRIVVVGACAAAVLVGALFSVRGINHAAAPWLGSPTIVLLAAAAWVPLGSLVIYGAAFYRAPALLLIVLWLAFCTIFNNNHVVRRLDTVTPPPTSVASVVTAVPKSGDKTYVIMVAADGGGIRAAYWAGTMLAALHDRYADFSSHLVAVSGVSGGSLGAGVYATLYAQRNAPRTGRLCAPAKGGEALTPYAQCVLAKDFLSPTLATMLFPDFLQRFLPFSVTYFDRGRTLEEAWELAWSGVMRNDALEAPFGALGSGQDRVPALILNSTDVDAGNRLIASNLALQPLDARDLGRLTGTVRLSTAMHNSARFTYVSPAGKLEGGGQVVDGGYFENTGATSLLDVLRAIAADDGLRKSVVPIAIHLQNSPESDKETPKAIRITSEIWAPVQTLAATRGAHGDWAALALKSAVESMNGTYIHVTVKKTNVGLPLGWALSEPARREMDRQRNEQVCSASSQLALALDKVLKPGRPDACPPPQPKP